MKYKKVIDAVQWDGNNIGEVFELIKYKCPFYYKNENEKELEIQTLEGNIIASVGDYIVKDVWGEFYACKPDIFEHTYEVVE